jgi:hypothetical protein
MKTVKLTGAILAAAILAQGCTNMETMPGPGSGGQSAACTREFVPVCGAKGYKRRTFNNSCLAKAKGYSVVKEGRCIG